MPADLCGVIDLVCLHYTRTTPGSHPDHTTVGGRCHAAVPRRCFPGRDHGDNRVQVLQVLRPEALESGGEGRGAARPGDRGRAQQHRLPLYPPGARGRAQQHRLPLYPPGAPARSSSLYAPGVAGRRWFPPLVWWRAGMPGT